MLSEQQQLLKHRPEPLICRWQVRLESSSQVQAGGRIGQDLLLRGKGLLQSAADLVSGALSFRGGPVSSVASHLDSRQILFEFNVVGLTL
jgi:hypothetical protein